MEEGYIYGFLSATFLLILIGWLFKQTRIQRKRKRLEYFDGMTFNDVVMLSVENFDDPEKDTVIDSEEEFQVTSNNVNSTLNRLYGECISELVINKIKN